MLNKISYTQDSQDFSTAKPQCVHPAQNNKKWVTERQPSDSIKDNQSVMSS